MAKLAFIGLGVMGYPMAGHLKTRGGHEVCVYNRTGARMRKWVEEYGGMGATTPAEAARDCDFVFSCVGNDDDVRQVLTGPSGALSGARKGAVIVDHTTASERLAREIAAEAAQVGCGFVDAPVSGGQAGAEKGVLTVMAGGSGEDFARARPVMESHAATIVHMGDAGAGQLAKMVNQICIAGLIQGLSEGLYFAEKSGLDIEKVIAAISKGAAHSWQMENRWKTMRDNQFDFGFAVDWMRKDLRICLDSAEQCGARLPVTALVNQFYGDVQALGGGRHDTSSLLARLRHFDSMSANRS